MDYETYKALDPQGREAAWASMTDAQQDAIEAEIAARRGGTTPPPISRKDAASMGFRQGLTFGLSEELGSLSRLVPGGESPQEYRDRKRAEIERMQTEQPGAYLSGEVGGAIAGSAVPFAGWVTGPARAARAGTLVGKLGAAASRGAVFGGADAAAQAAGRGEGYGWDRARAGITAAPVGAATGLALGPLGEVAGAGLRSAGMQKALDFVAQKFGRSASVAVGRNLQDVARETGMTVDEVLQRVESGQPLAGINDTTRAYARAVKNVGGGTIGTEMTQTVGDRLSNTTQRIVTEGQETLLGGPRALGSGLRAEVERGLSMGRDTAGDVLDEARVAAGQVTDPTTYEAMEAVGPSVARSVNRALVEAGKPPLYVMDPETKVFQLARPPSVQEAELVGTASSNVASRFYQPGSLNTGAAEVAEAQGKAVREAVDTSYPNVAKPRQAYSQAADAEKVVYPEAQKIDKTPPSVFNPFFDELTPVGREAAKEGAAVRLADMPGASGQDTSFIDQLLEGGVTGGTQRPLRTNLDTLTGGEFGQRVGPTVQRAKEESQLLAALTGNSTTAQQDRIMRRLDNAATGQSILESAPTTEVGQLAYKALRTAFGTDSGMTPEQIQEFGRLLMTVDERELKAAINSGPSAIWRLMDRLGGGVASNRAAAGAAGGLAGGEGAPTIMDILGGQ